MTDLANLANRRVGRSKRISSWDKTGGNKDWISFEPGDKKVIAEASGSGVIRHVWFTINHRDEMYLRKMVLRAWWDGEETPSIEVPIGDFFCLGHGIAKSFQNAAFNTVTHHDNESNVGGGIALNCYFSMPYGHGMKIEIENDSHLLCDSFYYYVDYDELDSLPEDSLRFHAQYRQEYPTVVDGGPLCERGEHYWDHMSDPNFGDDGNYLVFEAVGCGHFVGCNISVENIDPTPWTKKFGEYEYRVPELTWWGEGDDMFFIDDDTWPPSLHGTGSEDYLTQAWGMHNRQYLYAGASIHEHDDKHKDRKALTSYRIHVHDPVLFSKRIRFSIEHGHANLQQNDYSSVAYWYQTEPHAEFPKLPEVNHRVPRFFRKSG
ncbi:MAG: glycoside hydrolase family 172 protein [Fimbriimonadales bacterium]